MSPYLTILAINACILGVAYGAVYPRLDPLTARRMMRADLLVTGAALAAAGLIFAGRGLDFAIGPVALRWWGFSLLTMLLIEAPVFWAFCRARKVSLTDLDAPAPPPGT
jgi:fatty acid desaturase